MQRCDERDADLVIDGVHYRLENLAECKTMGRLRGAAGVEFADYYHTRQRLEEEHRASRTSGSIRAETYGFALQ